MAETRIICTNCPRGCNIIVRHGGGLIEGMSGNACEKGITYAKNEFESPVRILTSTIKISGGDLPLLPVKTKEPIPKNKMFDCIMELCSVRAAAPVKLGDVVLDNVCETGVAVVATRDIA
ncbi:MAG: DUF1667 domain-containing protein [Treponema sp.]|jgi:CxxC motif-containing protein|nr:DUF1667 domain-containing protein [Treponema sp.]